MRLPFFLTLLSVMIFTQIFSQSNSKPSPLFGVWQLVSGRYTVGNSTNKVDSSQVVQFKVITKDWYMFSTFRKDNRMLLGSVAGTHLINGNTLTSTAHYAATPQRIGTTGTYTMVVNGKRLHQKGRLVNMDIDEIWVKITN